MAKNSGSAGPNEGTIQYVQVRIGKKVHSDAKDKAKSLNLSANSYYTGLVHRDLYTNSPDSLAELVDHFTQEIGDIKKTMKAANEKHRVQNKLLSEEHIALSKVLVAMQKDVKTITNVFKKSKLI